MRLPGKAPCENCLVMPICRAKVSGKGLYSLLGLTDNCELLRSFIYPIPPVTGNKLLFLDECINKLRLSLLEGVNFSGEPLS